MSPGYDDPEVQAITLLIQNIFRHMLTPMKPEHVRELSAVIREILLRTLANRIDAGRAADILAMHFENAFEIALARLVLGMK